jgi:hypothetical protein
MTIEQKTPELLASSNIDDPPTINLPSAMDDYLAQMRDMASDDLLNNSWTMHNFARSYAKSGTLPDEVTVAYKKLAKVVDNKCDQCEKIVRHTLKRLDEKGLRKIFIGSSAQLESKYSRISAQSVKLLTIFQSFTAAIMCDSTTANMMIHTVSDEEWYSAIELGVLLKRPELLSDDKITSYAPFIDELYPYIWFALAAIRSIHEVRLRDDILRQYTELVELGRRTAAKNTSLEKRLDAVKTQSATKNKALAVDVANTKKLLREAKRENTALTNALAREKREREKEKRALVAEIERLRAIAPTSSSASFAAQENSSAVVSDDERPVSQEPRAEADIPLPDLPRTGVAFIGGHPKLVAKLELLFPEWRFLTVGRNDNIPDSYSADTVFAYTSHIAHKTYRKCLSSLRDDALLIYVSATNLDLLIAEMKTKLYCNDNSLVIY